VDQLDRLMPGFATKKSKTGSSFDYFIIGNRLRGVDFKIRYAAMCINELQKVHDQLKRDFEKESDFSEVFRRQPPLSEDVLFNADVTFSFLSSALDIASWPIQMIHGTKLKDREVHLRSVCGILSGNPAPEYEIFRKLSREYDEGWLAKFEAYRNYVTHYGLLRIGTSTTWEEKSPRIQAKVIVLPDDPNAPMARFDEGRELVPYAKDSMQHVLSAIGDLYKFVAKLI